MGVAHRSVQNTYLKIYKEYYGDIPKGYHVHHKDFNPYNNSPENLIAISPEEHAKIHIEAGHPWAHNGKFIQGASEAGKKGAKAFRSKLTPDQIKEWHSKGGKASQNKGGYNMSEMGKKNISIARLSGARYVCPICKSKPMDGGNFNKHIILKHNVNKLDCYQWRSGSKVDS